MPKSKRSKIVSLTQVGKKGYERKEALVDSIRQCIEDFKYLYVFSFENMRSSKFKDARIALRDSRFFMGKNKVMQVALGRDPSEELRENLHKISEHLTGHVGLLFSNEKKDKVKEFFAGLKSTDFARAGAVAPQTVERAAGPMDWFPPSIEPHLRKLGLPVSLKNGVVVLDTDYTICTEGEVLTPEQCKLLEQIATFKVDLECMWSNGKYQEIA